ncbi:MAG: formylglycine-generating enzyme family protein, partial [Candidatus Methylumidiphilus sp.]
IREPMEYRVSTVSAILPVLRRLQPADEFEGLLQASAVHSVGAGMCVLDIQAIGIGQASLPTGISPNGEVELLSIPGGNFLMGSPDGVGRESEYPQHRVQIKPFRLGRYPVTNEQYRSFLQANPKAQEPHYWGDRRFNQSQQPVVGISWDDAQKFCAWAGGRLPTEAEWEYACRAGTATQFHWGDDEGKAADYAWYGDDWEKGSTHAVGEKLPNPWGLYDMTGNVWEWGQDIWHENYQGSPGDGLAWMLTGDENRGVIRGGSWINLPAYLRSAYRGRFNRDIRYGNLGFRLAQDN